MAISYSGLRSYGKSTLPSVEGGFGSMNIARDPPKSIHTRRRDKVGENLELTAMLEEGSDRVCEAIQVYARGVNPSVSVSYSNHGNNGGTSGSIVTNNAKGGAKLPYRIMQDGVFRPPVLRQENLLPLSRLPRAWTSASTKPGFADFSKKMQCPQSAEKTKEVKNHLLKQCVRPTAVYKLEKPIEPFNIDYAIQDNVIHVSADAGVRAMDRTEQVVGVPTKNVYDDPFHAQAQTTYSNNRNYVNNNEVDTSRYTHDVLVADARTNPVSKYGNTSSIEDVLDLGDIRTKETLHTDYTTPISGVERNNYVHDDIQLERRMPIHSSRTNQNKNIYKRTEYENELDFQRNTPLTSFVSNPVAMGNEQVSSRERQLRPKVNPGGYSVIGQKPKETRMQTVGLHADPHKALMSKLISESMNTRFN